MRAERFPLELPVKYRPLGSNVWFEGTTENISRSGVLFRTDHIVDVDTPIEIDIALLPGAAGRADVHCHGRIVRSERRAPLPAAVAVVFSDYEFVRQNTPRTKTRG
jgi:hypothetical protein